MHDNLNATMDLVYENEVGPFWKTGGLVDHPKDPGGLTKWGIAQRSHPGVNIRELTKEHATRIYEQGYWKPCGGPELPYGVDTVTMDASVNSGVSRGVKWTQRALGVTDDGKAGPVTFAAAHSADGIKVIKRACASRLGFMRSLRIWDTFKGGWSNRMAKTEAVAVRMYAQSKADGSSARSVLLDEKTTATTRSKQQGGAAGGLGSTGTAVGVSFNDVDPTMLIVGVAVALLVIVTIAVRAGHNRNRAKAYEAEAITVGVQA